MPKKNEKNTNSYEALQSDHTALKLQFTYLEEKFTNLEAQLHDYATLQQRCTNLEAQSEKDKEMVQTLTLQNTELKKQLADLRTKHEDLEGILQAKLAENQTLLNENQILRIKLDSSPSQSTYIEFSDILETIANVQNGTTLDDLTKRILLIILRFLHQYNNLPEALFRINLSPEGITVQSFPKLTVNEESERPNAERIINFYGNVQYDATQQVTISTIPELNVVQRRQPAEIVSQQRPNRNNRWTTRNNTGAVPQGPGLFPQGAPRDIFTATVQQTMGIFPQQASMYNFTSGAVPQTRELFPQLPNIIPQPWNQRSIQVEGPTLGELIGSFRNAMRPGHIENNAATEPTANTLSFSLDFLDL